MVGRFRSAPRSSALSSRCSRWRRTGRCRRTGSPRASGATSPPPSAGKMVQQHVSQLRKALDGQDVTITTRARGYELALRAGRRRPGARRAPGRRPPRRAASNGAAREALALWRGPPLADLADEPFAAAEIRRCDELWLQAKELAIDADLAAGRHEDVLREVMTLAAEHPLQEHVQAQLMLALYRSGRQTEALEVFRATRARLVEEIGSEPGPELRRLHEEMLHQSPSLDPPARVRAAPAREPAPAAAGARAVAARRPRAARCSLAGVAARRRRAAADTALGEDAVALIDPDSGAVARDLRGRARPGAVATGGGSVWVANALDGTVTPLDRSTSRSSRSPSARTRGARLRRRLAVGRRRRPRGRADRPGERTRVVQRIDVGGQPTALAVGYGAAVGRAAARGRGRAPRPRRRRPAQRLAAGAGPSALAAGAGAVWVAAEDSGQLRAARAGPGLADRGDQRRQRPGGGRGGGGRGVGGQPARRHDLPRRPEGGRGGRHAQGRGRGDLARGRGRQRVGRRRGARRRIARLEPASGRVTADAASTGSPGALAAGGRSLWAAAGARPASHRGGRLVVEAATAGATASDPAPPDTRRRWESLTLVYDGLARLPARAGRRGRGARRRARHRGARADRRRPHLRVHAAARHPLLRRPARARRRLPRVAGARHPAERADAARLLRELLGARGVRAGRRAATSRARSRRRARADGDDPPAPPRPELLYKLAR